jgi:cytochrome c peroxidase
VYDNWGQSISFFESSKNVSAFSSKFAAYLAGAYTLTAEEQTGYDLFRSKAGCNTCHLDGRRSTQEGGTDTSAAANVEPLVTCFGYANLGLPLNPRDAFY